MTTQSELLSNFISICVLIQDEYARLVRTIPKWVEPLAAFQSIIETHSEEVYQAINDFHAKNALGYVKPIFGDSGITDGFWKSRAVSTPGIYLNRRWNSKPESCHGPVILVKSGLGLPIGEIYVSATELSVKYGDEDSAVDILPAKVLCDFYKLLLSVLPANHIDRDTLEANVEALSKYIDTTPASIPPSNGLQDIISGITSNPQISQVLSGFQSGQVDLPSLFSQLMNGQALSSTISQVAADPEFSGIKQSLSEITSQVDLQGQPADLIGQLTSSVGNTQLMNQLGAVDFGSLASKLLNGLSSGMTTESTQNPSLQN